MKTVQEMVREFNLAFGNMLAEKPTTLNVEDDQLALNLLYEEVKETADAMAFDENFEDASANYPLFSPRYLRKTGVNEGNIVETADGLGDIVYIAYGEALKRGIDLDAVIAEIHASNMSKLGEDGKPIIREDGKILKGPSYRKPDLARVLFF
jgi:predicted HAD superfamily Cof-like phosphohydrolase